MRDNVANMQSEGNILIDCFPFYFASMEPGTREPGTRGG